MRKPEAKETGEVSSMRFMAESAWHTAYPTLVEWLAEDRWDDGSVRETATLLLFVEAGRWKACLHDRALSRTVFLSAETPEELLTSFQAALAEDRLEWRSRATRTPSRGSAGK